MKAHSIGRALGIGMRVAGRMAGQRAAGGAADANARPAAAGAQSRAAGQVAGKATRGLARGVGGFLRPFGRIGGILWLEVTGVFFLLFAIVFARALWLYRASFAQGPDHQKFLVTAPLLLLFVYLSISSFWRARRR